MIRYWLPALDLLLLAGAILSMYLSREPRKAPGAPVPLPVTDDPTGPATLRTAPPALLYAGPAAGGLVLPRRGRVRIHLRPGRREESHPEVRRYLMSLARRQRAA